MTSGAVHEAYEELLVGYALSALEPEDEQLLLQHLSSCALCDRALVMHLETLSHLAYAAEPAVPPQALLDGIMRQVRADVGPGFTGALDEPVGAPAQPVASASSRPAAGGSRALASPDELSRARARRRLRRAGSWTSVAAALVLVIGLGTWNVALRQDNSRSTLPDRIATAVKQSPGRTVPLVTPQGQPLAVAVVHDAGDLSLLVDGLSPNPTATSTYVLWGWQLGQQPQALTTFDVRAGTVDAVANVALPASLRPVPYLLAVTRESGRTAPPGPTSDPIVTGRSA